MTEKKEQLQKSQCGSDSKLQSMVTAVNLEQRICVFRQFWHPVDNSVSIKSAQNQFLSESVVRTWTNRLRKMKRLFPMSTTAAPSEVKAGIKGKALYYKPAAI